MCIEGDIQLTYCQIRLQETSNKRVGSCEAQAMQHETKLPLPKRKKTQFPQGMEVKHLCRHPSRKVSEIKTGSKCNSSIK